MALWRRLVASVGVVVALGMSLVWAAVPAYASGLTNGTSDSNGAMVECNVSYNEVAWAASSDEAESGSGYGLSGFSTTPNGFLELLVNCDWNYKYTAAGSVTSERLYIAPCSADAGNSPVPACPSQPMPASVGTGAGYSSSSDGPPFCGGPEFCAYFDWSATVANGSSSLTYANSDHDGGGFATPGNGNGFLPGDTCHGAYSSDGTGNYGVDCTAVPAASGWRCSFQDVGSNNYLPCRVETATASTSAPSQPSEYWASGSPPPASTPTPILSLSSAPENTTIGAYYCATAAKISPATGVATVTAALDASSPALPGSGVTQSMYWAWEDGSGNTTGAFSATHSYSPPDEPSGGWYAEFFLTWTGDGTTYTGTHTATCILNVSFVNPASGGSGGIDLPSCSFWDILCDLESAAEWLLVPNTTDLQDAWSGLANTVSASVPFAYITAAPEAVYTFQSHVSAAFTGAECMNLIPNGDLPIGPTGYTQHDTSSDTLDGSALCPDGWVGAQTTGNHLPYIAPGTPCTAADACYGISYGSEQQTWLATAENYSQLFSLTIVSTILAIGAIRLASRVLMAK